ncbi:hypothetical protein [Anaerosporobacter sp.]|uniref:hypothetical protein n=1 Tax=Anaerosporobacter sp. TaxID=1872529 RepID=UPI00286F2535|nr:hypothetical protein [Anaerosporobacter sp.]
MCAISYERIKLKGGLGITEIKELEIQIEPNRHATARIVGVISKKKHEEKMKSIHLEEHVVKIIILEEDGSEPLQPLFSGYPRSVRYKEKEGISYLDIQLSSGTILLDREIKSRSFQDVSKDYPSLVKALIKDTSRADVICNENTIKNLVKPLIQYMETDWEFIMRLASHVNGVLYPEVREPYPRFWFGMPGVVKKRKIAKVEYETGISEQFFIQGGEEAGLRQNQFLYYKIEETKDYDIGDKAEFNEQELQICQKTVTLQQGELCFSYILAREQLVALKYRDNEVFAGLSILGKVIKVDGETIRIHLDIDKEQNEDTAYAYDWVPDTGSMMYCMPKVGSTVSLYFSNEKESSAQAVNCIKTGKVGVKKKSKETIASQAVSSKTVTSQTSSSQASYNIVVNASSGASDSNGEDDSEEEENPDRKCLSTEHGKELYLAETAIGLSAEESGLELTLEDEGAVTLKSSKKLSITAEGKVRLVGKNVVLHTPTEMKMART